MLACKYAALMLEKGEFQKAEVLFKPPANFIEYRMKVQSPQTL
jgi:hypothetical protein